MGFLARLKTAALKGVRGLWTKISTARPRFSRRPSSPLADRLLTDTLRLAELPSPTEKEEKRAEFILERLASLGIPGDVDEDGNITATIPVEGTGDARPLLLFADLGTTRWSPLGSLSRLDPEKAIGAGISDSLGAAALLSIAEGVHSGSIKPGGSLLLLFAARSLHDPRSEIFKRLVEHSALRPAAAIGARGIGLGALSQKPLGTYRLSVMVRTLDPTEAAVHPSETAKGVHSQSAVSAAVLVAQRLGGVKWDSEGATSCHVRRIVAGTGFGRFPTEGVVDIEIESADAKVLEMAMKAATATAETVGKELSANLMVSIVGYVPVGEPSISASLISSAKEAMRELKIKQTDDPGADLAAFLSALGVPAVSLGIAYGHVGIELDEIDVTSIESGRRLLVAMTERSFTVADRREKAR